MIISSLFFKIHPHKKDSLYAKILAYYRLLYQQRSICTPIQPDILYQLDLLHQRTRQVVENQVVIFLCIKGFIFEYLDMGENIKRYARHLYKITRFIVGHFEAFWIDYSFLELNEAKRCKFKLPSVPECFTIEKSKYFIIEPQDLSTAVASICGVIVPKVHTIHLLKYSTHWPVPYHKTVLLLSSTREKD